MWVCQGDEHLDFPNAFPCHFHGFVVDSRAMSLRTRAPLFHARILRDRLAGFVFPSDLAERRAILQKWVLALRAGKLDAAKEVSLHGEFF